MLKSSDRISHDVETLLQHRQAAASASSDTVTALAPILVLCKWHELRPEREFRCFVRGGALVGACQRDVSQHFPQLTSGGMDSAAEGVDITDVNGVREEGSELSADEVNSSVRAGPLDDVKQAIARFHRGHVSTVVESLLQCERKGRHGGVEEHAGKGNKG